MNYHNIVSHLNVQFAHYKNKVARYCAILVCAGLSLASPLNYALGISDRDFYQTGLAFYRAGQLSEAANNWQALARDNQSQDDEVKKQAAFAAVLATLVWEKLENANAYTTWSEAIRLYLEANTNWEQERLALKQRITGNRVALQQLTSDVVLSIEPFEQLLLDMDESYALTDYQGPRTGLQKNETEATLDVMQYVMPTPQPAIVPPVLEPVPQSPIIPDASISNSSGKSESIDSSKELSLPTDKPLEPIVEPSPVVVEESFASPESLQTTPSSSAESESEPEAIKQPTFSGHIIPLDSN